MFAAVNDITINQHNMPIRFHTLDKLANDLLLRFINYVIFYKPFIKHLAD